MVYTRANLLELVPFFFFHASGQSSNNIKLKIVSGKITFSQIVKNSTISATHTHIHTIFQISNEAGERQVNLGWANIYLFMCISKPVLD